MIRSAISLPDSRIWLWIALARDARVFDAVALKLQPQHDLITACRGGNVHDRRGLVRRPAVRVELAPAAT